MADKNTNSLLDALKRSRMKEAEKLLELGVDPNNQTEDHTVTPMHLAAGLGLEAVSLLLQHGGDPNICIEDGTTPLHVAAIWGNSDSVQILLANGGDPFIKDLDGMSALDLADQYGHVGVKQVIRYYMALLANTDDQTLTPKFTYKRRSLISNESGSQEADSNDPVDVSVYNESAIDSYLQQFARRRCSSMFLRSIQHQVDQYFGQGQKTHLVDVTSPDHPYVEPRDEADQSFEESENSLNLQLSLSDNEQSTSCDSFITCDGEDLDTVLRDSAIKADLDSPRSPAYLNTVIKNPKYYKNASPTNTNTSCSTESTITENRRQSTQTPSRSRRDKYCKRGPLFGSIQTQEDVVQQKQKSLGDRNKVLSAYEFHRHLEPCYAQPSKCDYCGCITNVGSGKKERICETCEMLGQELDEIMNDAGQLDVGAIESQMLPDLLQTSSTSYTSQKHARDRYKDDSDYLTVGKSHSGSREVTSPDVLTELSRRLSQTNLDTKMMNKNNSSAKNGHCFKDSEKGQVTYTSNHDQLLGMSQSSDKANTGFYNQDLNDSLISDFSIIDKPATIKKAEFHPSDISTITISDDSLEDCGVLDQAYCQNRMTNSNKNGRQINNAQTYKKLETKERKGKQSAISNQNVNANRNPVSQRKHDKFDAGLMPKRQSNVALKSNQHYTDAIENRIGNYRNVERVKTPVDRFFPGDSQSPEVNDLWSEVRASSIQRKRLRQRDLDTAFVGRESVGSVVSDASTVEYVYTDTENDIVLIEKHIPSKCGSTGSRRSLDSLFSLNTNDNNASPSSAQELLNNSQDTILYDWQDMAMIQEPTHTTRGSSHNIQGSSQNTRGSSHSAQGSSHNVQGSSHKILGSSNNSKGSSHSVQGSSHSIHSSSNDKENSPSQPISQDIIKLDNDTLRTKLVAFGDDPGPVTKTTRQAYLRRLSQLQADPDAKLLTKKGPGFPPELSAALRGTLDLSDMPEIETKMVATFQNPNRQRRWREGTLKSSFNYILLDPRITKELPNRSANMSDLEVFQTFIYATFYIGKGKRARPYSHLYEAIREMKKPSGKSSQKIDRILEIWAGDQGVVSLHCFQSVIPVEAYTREACMVDAMGLSHLTNKKRGDYYGVSTTYSMKQRRKMGVYLLSKALQIFLAEGERQISPLDIKNDV